MQKRKGLCRITAMAMALLLCAGCGNDGGSRRDDDREKSVESAKATTMHLADTRGSVVIVNDEGKEMEAARQLKLYDGYQVGTWEESYAWINLDDVKLTRMDEVSEIEIHRDGKDLEIELKSGALFFHVTKPLEEDESFEIRTSTTAVGIRGTCGWVKVDEYNHLKLFLLEGTVEYTYEDPDSGETRSETVEERTMAELVLQEDGSFKIQVEMPDTWYIPDYVKEEVGEDRVRAMMEEYGITPVFGEENAEPEASGNLPSEPEDMPAPEEESAETILTMPITAREIFNTLYSTKSETIIVESDGEETVLDVEFMSVPEGKTLIFGEGITVNFIYMDDSEGKGGGMDIDGNVVINGNLLNNANGTLNVGLGILTVNGSVENGPDGWILIGTSMGEINSDARLIVTEGLTSSGQFWNYGIVEGDVTLNGGYMLQQGEITGTFVNNGAVSY